MRLIKAINALTDGGTTKYRIAKTIGVESIVIDKILKGKQHTVNAAIAHIFLRDFGIPIDEQDINVHTGSVKQLKLAGMLDDFRTT